MKTPISKIILSLFGAAVFLAPSTLEAAPRTSRARTTVRRTSRTTTARRAPARRAPVRRVSTARRYDGRRGSFSSVPMSSKQQLMQRLRTDPVFRRNLARHYGIPESEVVRYMEQNVVFTRLPKRRTDGVYGVSSSGRSFRVVQNLPQGTPVFALPGGYVVLKANCGNPLRRGLPPEQRPVPPVAFIPPPEFVASVPPPVPEVTLPITPAVVPVTSPLPPVVAMMLPPAETFTTPGILTPVAYVPPPVPPGGGGGIPFFIPPFWIPGGGGDTPFGSGFVQRPVPVPVIPEPTSVALFLAGGVPVLMMNRRRLSLPFTRRSRKEEAA